MEKSCIQLLPEFVFKAAVLKLLLLCPTSETLKQFLPHNPIRAAAIDYFSNQELRLID